MFVNEFESSSAYRLQQIVSTLKSVHGVELDLNRHSDDEVRALGESSEIIKNSIVKESAFNSWMQNPEYTKNMLILEAVRIYLTEIAPKRMPRRSKAVKESAIAEAGPADTVQSAELGRAMMDYAEKAPHGGDEKELRILNAISQVGDKLTQLGTPFGPKTLTDLDKKVIYFAKKRMGRDATIEENPQQPPKPGTVTMSKDGVTTTVPPEKVSAELPKLTSQGFKPTEVKETTDELAQLMKQYGVDEHSGMEEGNEFSGALAAAKAAGKDKFTVGGKTYDVKEASAMMEAAKGQDLAALRKKKAELEDKMDEIVKDGGKVLKTDPLRKRYEKVVADIKAAKAAVAEGMADWDVTISSMPRTEPFKLKKIVVKSPHGKIYTFDTEDDARRLFLDRWEKVKDPSSGWTVDMNNTKKTMTEGMHMEAHDDYQASMARSELYRNTKYAMDMMKMIGPEDDVKPWIAANLTKAAHALDKIYHYMDYYLTFEPEKIRNVEEDAGIVVDEGSVGSVARKNLMLIMEYSTKLFRMIQPGDKLEGWVAMKLTNASEAISSSKHYMDYAQFEKHVGYEMSDVVDEPVDLPLMPMQEEKGKKGKKKIKEGRLVTVGNILMNAMISEDQDLAQAQTLLAAKAMSDDLQNMAEKIAKMSVEDLMPIVDTMKEQFGQELANGFNDTMKASLEAVLNSATEAKETADNAILSLQAGQVPGTGTTDIETAGEIAAEPAAGEDDDFASTPAAAGPEEEPLGRAEKSDDEEAPEDLAESKRAKEPGAVATAQVMKMGGRFVTKDGEHLTKAGIKKRDEIVKAIEDEKKLQEAKRAKPDFLDVDRDGNKKESMKKAAADKAKKAKVDETKMEEAAPPGKKAEDFIKKNKASFKDRYGDRWEEVLYATAWKQFGKKEESAIKTAKMLESAKARKSQLVKAFEAHKASFKKMVSEGMAKDPLKTGYGLDGETLLDQIGDVDGMISKLKEMLRAEMQAGVGKMVADAKQTEKAEILESKKQAAPYGVMWKTGDSRKSKFFETADLRSYWLDLNQVNLAEAKLINPEDFDRKITNLNKKG